MSGAGGVGVSGDVHHASVQKLDDIWTDWVEWGTVPVQLLDRKEPLIMYKIVENSQQRAIGSKTLILLAAGLSFLLSVSLWFTGNEQQAIFVGLWVPSILSLGAIILPRGELS